MQHPQRDSLLLERIPMQRLSSEQQKLLPIQFGAVHVPICRFSREPTHLEELDWETYSKVYIWRENQTVICISDNSLANYPQRNVSFAICHDNKYLRNCAIYGTNDATIAETATFFWALKYAGERHSYLEIRHGGLFSFNLAALQPEQLARILDANPKRLVEFQTGSWSPEHASIFATRPSPLSLRLSTTSMRIGGFSFQDNGTAFVNALTTRQSSFGSLYIDFEENGYPFSTQNIKRLVKLEGTFEKIGFFILPKENVLIPFSAKANALEYQFKAKSIQPEDFNSVDISPKDLVLNMFLDGVVDWDKPLISFLNRLAALGHFEKLDLNLDYLDDVEQHELDDASSNIVAEAMVRVITSNRNLKHLDVSGMHEHLNWDIHLQNIFKAMEDHEGIRTLVLRKFPLSSSHPAYLSMKQLFSRNRNVSVLDSSGNGCCAFQILI